MYKQEETLKVVHRNIFRFKTQRRERENVDVLSVRLKGNAIIINEQVQIIVKNINYVYV